MSGALALTLAGPTASSAAAAQEPASAFARPSGALAPVAPIEGRLEIAFKARPDGLEVLRDDAPPLGRDPRKAWPVLRADLVSDGARLIPRIAPSPTEGPAAWDWSAGPGEIWSVGQGAVAVFPVALRELNANCVHQGLARLTFDARGGVRDAKVQIGAQTCVYYRFNAWSFGQPRFVRAPVADREGLLMRDRALRAAQLPSRPLAELETRYPGARAARLAAAAGDPDAVYGLVADGVNYVAPCPMSFGQDPYCQGRTLPSYSLAKSLVGALGLMRLERLHPGLAQTPVADLAPPCAARAWSKVRLIDLLDMASGHYRSSVPQADESAPDLLPFFASRTHAQKLAFACGHYPQRAAAGAAFVYHTADSYLLGAAMSQALGTEPADARDLYDDILRPIWRSLSLSPLLDETRRTLDDVGQPFTGWGLFLTRDDAARLGTFLSPADTVARADLFDTDLIDAALQRPGHQGEGLAAGAPDLRYVHGFWARDIAPLVGCAHSVWTPFLSGYGGISIVLFPNGVVFYAFGDENRFDWGPAAEVANRVKALCP